MFSARCKKDGSLLFDVPNYGGFGKPRFKAGKRLPVVITCRSCGAKYTICETPVGDVVAHRYGQKKRTLKVEQHD